MTKKIDHTTIHPLNEDYYLSHCALRRVDEDEWECVHCGCPHTVMRISEEEESWAALESVQCPPSFEQECESCGGVGRCDPDCPSMIETIKNMILEMAKEKGIDPEDVSIEVGEPEGGELFSKESTPLYESEDTVEGLPVFGGPYEA